MTAAVESPLRFPGQYYDAATKLHYNYYRDYDPTTGRYIESDPIGLEGEINAYAYVNNNPIASSDFSGLSPVTSVGLCLLFPESCNGGGGRGDESWKNVPTRKCAWARYKQLKGEQDEACARPNSCRGITNCNEIVKKIYNDQWCFEARLNLMKECFGGGGSRHFGPLDDINRSIEYCLDRHIEICRSCPNSDK